MTVCNKSVVDFYNNQTVFLTGATGFVGKVILEKLLRDCPKVPKLYVLVRPKKGKTRKERFDQLFESPCFNRLKKERPDFRSQVQLIEGDCDEPELGLDEHDRRLLISDVTMVIHAAANVKFDQTLRSAANNLKAAMVVVELCKQMPQLTALVYVSTAFSNCPHSHIKEDFYKPPMTSEVFLALVEELDDERLEAITPGLLGPWPNTYVFIKSMIEDYLRRHCAGIPAALVRPSIVVSAIREPMPGWCDSLYGPTGIAMGGSLGVLRSLYATRNVKAQMIPLDSVCNIVLLAGWSLGRDELKNTSVKVFNAVAEESIMFTWGEFVDRLHSHDWNSAPLKQVWFNTLTISESKFRHDLIIFFGHTVVAHFVDMVLWLIGREPLAVKNYERLNKLLELTSHFTTRSWNIDRDNVDELDAQLTNDERKMFQTTHLDLDKAKSMEDAVSNHRWIIMKESTDTLPRARVKYVIFGILHYTFLSVLCYILFRFFYCMFKYIW